MTRTTEDILRDHPDEERGALRPPGNSGEPGGRARGENECSSLKKGVTCCFVAVQLAIGMCLIYYAVPKLRCGNSDTYDTQEDGSPGSPTFDTEGISKRRPCDLGWVPYRCKCYHFSVVEGNWSTANESCTRLHSFLAVIENQHELNFTRQIKGAADRWIGLEKQKGERWAWVDGSAYHPWFEVEGGSSCAYLHLQEVASARCSSSRHWLCSKRAKLMKERSPQKKIHHKIR